MGDTTSGGVVISGTTPDPKNITLPDVDYAYILTLKDLTTAIKELAHAVKRNG